MPKPTRFPRPGSESSRWEYDAGAIPGEPEMYLDVIGKPLEEANAFIITNENDTKTPYELRVRDRSGYRTAGRFDKAWKAQIAGEYLFPKQAKKSLRILGAARYQLRFKSASAPRLISFRSAAGFPDSESLDEKDIYHVLYDPRSNQWHAPNKGRASQGFDHADIIDAVDASPERDLHLIRGYWSPQDNEVEIYGLESVASFLGEKLGRLPESVAKIIGRSKQRALSNSFKYRGKPVVVREIDPLSYSDL